MKRRWLVYLLVGIGFGVIDFHYQEWTLGLSRSPAEWFAVAWGIWLAPAVPIIVHECRMSRSRLKSALAVILTWSAATVSYYLYLIVKLVFIGQATLPELHISNRGDPFFWDNVKSLVLGDVLHGIGEWAIVALVGGLMAGLAVSSVYMGVSRRLAQSSGNKKSGV